MESLLIEEKASHRRENIGSRDTHSTSSFKHRLATVNRELWLVLSLFIVTGFINWLVASHRMIVGFYTLPTLFSAYVYGRRHAVLTATASIFIVVVLVLTNTSLFMVPAPLDSTYDRWADLITWAGLLLITAYAMGSLYERKERHLNELRETYFGVLAILQQFTSNDTYTHNHSHRVALYASAIAGRMGFDKERIDDVRAAALLHEIGKLETSRKLLANAADLTAEKMQETQSYARKVAMLEPVGGALRRVLPIILAHHDKYDGTSDGHLQGSEIPIEARVLAVADAHDTLTSDRPYRRAVTPFEARQIIVSGVGTSFDPTVVEAYVSAFERGQLEIPNTLEV